MSGAASVSELGAAATQQRAEPNTRRSEQSERSMGSLIFPVDHSALSE